MTNAPITLFPFASEAYSDAIANTLYRLGYMVNTVKSPDLRSLSRNINRGIAVFLFGEAVPSRDTVQALLHRTDTAARFGIFISEHRGLDAELVEHLSEFSSWPCSDGELLIRLDRLGYACPEQCYVEDDQALVDELVKLNIIGKSPPLLKTVHNVKRFACCEAPLLIEGETGTGKELAARAVHYLGKRRDYPFIPVNCGALPDQLVENELFGHEKGAYTDAGKSTPGLIAQAKGGTLFLDEIEALSPKAQVSLLRFLQDNEYRPLGGSQVLKANVRIVAASNTPIQDLVEQGRFRQDLYYRLNIMTIVMPPLRARGGDIKLLAEHYIAGYCSQYDQADKFISPATLKRLNQYRWPGNVRELENVIHRAFLLSEDREIRLYDIFDHPPSGAQGITEEMDFNVDSEFNLAKAQVISEFEKSYLSNILKETKGNITLAAKKAGKERRCLGKLIKKHGLDTRHYLGNEA